jgi:myo-inositol 2-dehydrogenase / D-chiro-inositol 1-dehydrogenase
MGDHQRVEVDGVLEVRHHRNPPFKADDPQATLADGSDTLAWKPNLTAAANEDFKGYHALLGAFMATLDGQATDLPTIDDGVAAMQVLEAMIAGIAAPGIAQRVAGA